jgi:hypothetical protein
MQYELDENVAVLRFDDGKANVVSHAFIDALFEGLDRADALERMRASLAGNTTWVALTPLPVSAGVALPGVGGVILR